MLPSVSHHRNSTPGVPAWFASHSGASRPTRHLLTGEPDKKPDNNRDDNQFHPVLPAPNLRPPPGNRRRRMHLLTLSRQREIDGDLRFDLNRLAEQ